MLTVSIHQTPFLCARAGILWLVSVLVPLTAAHAQSDVVLSSQPVEIAVGSAPQLLVEKNETGLPVGGFTLFPKLRLSTSYDNNVYLRDDNKLDDAIFTVNPSMELRSDWANHALNLHASSTHTRYATRTANNSDQYQAGGDGFLTINRAWVLSGSAAYGHLIEARGTPGNDFTVGRFVFYNSTLASARLAYRINRFLATAGYSYNRRQYDDVDIGGLKIDQSFRDHHVGAASLRLDYQEDATTRLFLSFVHNNLDYSKNIPLFDRSSTGFTILGGVNTELTRLIRGEVGLGYLKQNFKQPGLASFGGFNYQVDVVYTPTALTTVRFEADRNVLDGGDPQSRGVLNSRLRLTLEHELTRKVTLQAFAEHSNDRYRGIDRNDHRLYLGLSANYVLRRSISLAPFYKYQSRTSSGLQSVSSSHDNRVGVSLILAR